MKAMIQLGLIKTYGNNLRMSEKKVVILGANGMAGHMMYDYFKTKGFHYLVGITRKESNYTDLIVDCTDFNKLRDSLIDLKPDIVINCIGVLIKGAEENILNAIRLNSELPNFLSVLSNEINYKFIHISTDCVFFGDDGGYSENSFRDGDTCYARTKALGEVDNNYALTIRTSIIGPEIRENKTGLFNWFILQEKEVQGFVNVFWSGVTTLELAKAVLSILEMNLTGLCHLTSKNKISKFTLLSLIKKRWGMKNDIIKNKEYFSDKSLINTRDDFQYDVPEYNQMIDELYYYMKGMNS